MARSEKEMQDMIKILKNNGYRMTSQRIGILSALFKNKEKHLSVEEICSFVKDSRPTASLATVYKAVLQFEKLGLLCRISIYGDCSRYQLIPPGSESRHRHFVCTRCGKILDIDPKEFLDTERRLENKYGVLIESQNLLYYGTCGECACADGVK